MYMNYRPSGGSPASPQLDESAALGILQHLNKEELEELLNNDEKLDEYINDLQQVKSLQVDKETCLASNKSLAEYNLSRESKFTQAKQQLASTYEQAIKIQKQFDEHKQKLHYAGDSQSLDTVLALLQTEAAKAEEESESVADAFIDGSIEVEDFLEKYKSNRTVAHMRKVKSEKMQEIIRNRQRAPPRPAPPPPVGAVNNSWSAAPAQNHWGGGSVPYPTANFGMPDPSAYLPRWTLSFGRTRNF